MNAFGDTMSTMFSKRVSSFIDYIKGSTFKSVYELSDVVSVIVYCTTDHTVMLVVESNTNEYWIPSTKIQGGSSWMGHIAKDLLQDIFGTSAPLAKVLRFNKLWMPSTHKTPYIIHAVFQVEVTMELKKKSKSPFGKVGKIRWSTLDDVMKFYNTSFLKSPEIVEFVHWVMNKPLPTTNLPVEHIIVGNFLEITESVLVSGKNTIYDQIVDASGIDRYGILLTNKTTFNCLFSAQEVIYKEFLIMCFPSLYLNYQTFAKFVIGVGWPKEEAPHLYRSADLYDRGGVSFREFLYFLAATEPGTTHGGGPAELRCRYIFRYLDTDKNNLLMRDEIKKFIVLLRKSRKQPLDPAKIDKEVLECYQAIGVGEKHALTISEFLRAVGELKVRGTSQIYRAPNSIQMFVREVIERDAKQKTLYRGSQPQIFHTDNQNYEMAIHSVKIQKSGNAINVEQYWNIDNSTSASSVRPADCTAASRKISSDKFDQHSKSNELLKVLRYLCQGNKKMQCYVKIESFEFNWGNLDPILVAKQLASVCTEVKEILKKESRMLEISSPVYIMGDLHGNISDLLHFEKMLWHVGPGLCPCNLLFLGDYVDRGLYSFEVCCYLFAYKLQSPKKVFILRGNHEIKRVQAQWTFEKECKFKFGDKLGATVFDCINEVFDTLPLAAVVDGKVFCCHGGIPPPWLCPIASAINDIPPVLNDPQDQSSLAWELMWNDPIRSKFMTEKIAMELLANEGFAVNNRRGTAHIFSVEALEKFLDVNNFTHLVRAHEVVEAGFYLQQKGKLLTVFSSSKYCGTQNQAACILADQGKLRVVRLEIE